MSALPNRELLLVAGVGVAALVVLYVVSRHGAAAGRAIGQGAGDLAAGAVVGLGSSVGLPDPADPRVRAQGRAALERGDLYEASQKLPAGEFLAGLGSRLGLALAGVRESVSGSDARIRAMLQGAPAVSLGFSQLGDDALWAGMRSDEPDDGGLGAISTYFGIGA